MEKDSQQVLCLETQEVLELGALELGGHCEITKSTHQIKCEQLADDIYRLQSWHRARMESEGSKRDALEKTIQQLNDILRKFS